MTSGIDPILTPTVEVIGEGFRVTGHLVRATGQRVSDALNECERMLILTLATVEGVADLPTSANEVGINIDTIDLVIPVEEAFIRDPLRVIEKVRQPVALQVKGWTLTGEVSLVRGVTLERFVNVGHEEFFPVTDAVLVGPEGGRRAPVVLVRRHSVGVLIPDHTVAGFTTSVEVIEEMELVGSGERETVHARA